MSKEHIHTQIISEAFLFLKYLQPTLFTKLTVQTPKQLTVLSHNLTLYICVVSDGPDANHGTILRYAVFPRPTFAHSD
jgi:hypothetical protein